MSIMSSLSSGFNRAMAWTGILPTTPYDASNRSGPEMTGWNRNPGFPGSISRSDYDLIVGRAQDLDRNNGWVNGGIDRRVESVIGTNVRLSAQPAIGVLGRDINWRMDWASKTQARYRVWSTDIERRCDARQMFTIGQLARLAYIGYLRDGSCSAEVRDDFGRGLSNPTNVLLFDPQRISMPRNMALQEGPMLRDGIAFNEAGAPIGYWIASRHPGDNTSRYQPDSWTYVPRFGKTGRAKIIHVFNPRHVEQTQGISRLAEVMIPAKMLDRVDRAEVQAALKSALLSIFIKSPGTAEDMGQMLGAPSGNDSSLPDWFKPYVDYRSQNPVHMDGADIHQLLPDEDVVTPDRSSPNSNYPDFARFVLQKVAGSLGVSYPQLSQDWAGINYSSARALLNELWRSFLQDRQFFTDQFLTPIYAAWLEWEVANGDIKIPGGPANFYRNKSAICMAEWIGPGRGSVDPLKEANANNLDTAAGRKSTVQIILEDGRDPEDVMAENMWWHAELEKRGLPTPNYNVKPEAGAGEGETTGNVDPDRDGAGASNESKRKTQEGQPV